MSMPQELFDHREIITQAFSNPDSVGDGILMSVFQALVDKDAEYARKILRINGEKVCYSKSVGVVDAVIRMDLDSQNAKRLAAKISTTRQLADLEERELSEEDVAAIQLTDDEKATVPSPGIEQVIRRELEKKAIEMERASLQLQGEQMFCKQMIVLMKALAKGMEKKVVAPADQAILETALQQMSPIDTSKLPELPPTPLQVMVEEYREAGKCTFVDRGAKKPCGLKPASKSTEYCRKHK